MVHLKKPSTKDFLISRIGGLVAGGDALIAIPPDSDGYNASLTAELKKNVEVVRPGDLIFTRTPGNFYSFFRILANNSYDHMVVVLDKTTVLHIGPNRIRRLSLPIILDPLRKPFVLRPSFTGDENREKFLAECTALLGRDYDTIRVYQILIVLALKNFLKVELPLTPCNDNATKWTCTDAMWVRLMANSEQFRNTVEELSGLDNDTVGCVSMNDFIKVWGKSTVGALQEVELPIRKTTRTSANVRPKESSGIMSLIAQLIPDSVKNTYENIGPEGRIGLTVLLTYLVYLLVSSYSSHRNRNFSKSKTGKKRSKL